MTRPIGSYQHPPAGRLHQGHRMRLRNYIKGGLSRQETARICGVCPAYVSTLAKHWGFPLAPPARRGRRP